MVHGQRTLGDNRSNPMAPSRHQPDPVVAETNTGISVCPPDKNEQQSER